MMMVRMIDAASSHMVMPNTIFWKRPTASTLLIIAAALPKNVNRPGVCRACRVCVVCVVWRGVWGGVCVWVCGVG